MAKYLLKAAEYTHLPKGTRRIRASRHFFQNSIKHPNREPRAGGKTKCYFVMVSFADTLRAFTSKQYDVVALPETNNEYWIMRGIPNAKPPPIIDEAAPYLTYWEKFDIAMIRSAVDAKIEIYWQNRQRETQIKQQKASA
jgi:hypothetical protein